MLSDKNKLEVVDIMDPNVKSIEFTVKDKAEYENLIQKMPCVKDWLEKECSDVNTPLDVKIYRKKEYLYFLKRKAKSKLALYHFWNYGISKFLYPVEKFKWVPAHDDTNTHFQNIFYDEVTKAYMRENPFIAEIGADYKKSYAGSTRYIIIIIHYFDKHNFQIAFDKKEKTNKYTFSVEKVVNKLDTFFKV